MRSVFTRTMTLALKKSSIASLIALSLLSALAGCALSHEGMDMSGEKITGSTMAAMGCCTIRPGFGVPATITRLALPETSRSLLVLIVGLLALVAAAAHAIPLPTARDRDHRVRSIAADSRARRDEERAFRRAFLRGVAHPRLSEPALILI
jgi:hypothetical protein